MGTLTFDFYFLLNQLRLEILDFLDVTLFLSYKLHHFSACAAYKIFFLSVECFHSLTELLSILGDLVLEVRYNGAR